MKKNQIAIFTYLIISIVLIGFKIGHAEIFNPNVEVEAESGDITSPMQVVSGTYVITTTRDEGSVSFTFNIVDPGDYFLKAYVMTPDDGGTSDHNSFFVDMDNIPDITISEYVYDTVETASYVWDDVSLRGPNGSMTSAEYDPKIWTLTAGTHTIYIYGREEDTRLDKIKLVRYCGASGGTPTLITTHPTSQTVSEGQDVTFTVAADGDGLTYQWQKSSGSSEFVDITGETSSSYTFTTQSSDDGSSYLCVVTGSCGAATSDSATLTVNPVTGAGWTLSNGNVTTSNNVGIGTESPQSELAVNGTITTKAINVTVTGWADYVFKEEYNLFPLSQLEKYVKENNHLPGVLSEKEIIENGLPVASMMAKQMQKIEELTLYLIQMKKENDLLKAEKERIEARLTALENSQ